MKAIFDDSKKDLPTLVFFIELMCYNVPLRGIAKICGLNHKIAYEWRQRVFATVDAFGQARKRGLSKQKLCIAAAIDACKYALAVGHGKPSRVSGIACALTSPRGSTVVGDMEKSHRSPVRVVEGMHEAYRAHVSDPQYLECMALVNNLCF